MILIVKLKFQRILALFWMLLLNNWRKLFYCLSHSKRTVQLSIELTFFVVTSFTVLSVYIVWNDYVAVATIFISTGWINSFILFIKTFFTDFLFLIVLDFMLHHPFSQLTWNFTWLQKLLQLGFKSSKLLNINNEFLCWFPV